MKEITPSDKPRRLRWIRGADGRVKRASDGRTIGDLWAEQRRIRLADAIQADERKTQKRAARKALGGRWKIGLKALSKKASATPISQRLATVKLPRFVRRALRRLSKKQLFITGGIVVALLALFITGPSVSLLPGIGGPKKSAKITNTATLAAKAQKPDYKTILPGGKTIEDLGGWARVSPQDKNPVFAYTDKIAGVRIVVSEQPLPDSFKKDIQGSTADLAKQFNASDAVTTDSKATFYVGTSIKGPQSVVYADQGQSLLVLIKSDSKLTNQQWADYISALQ